MLNLKQKLMLKDRTHISNPLVFTLLLVMIISGCKDVDQSPPILTLESPGANAVFVSNSMVPVTGSARDNVGVSTVQAQVTSVLTNQVVGSGSGVVDEDGNFNFDVRMGDRYSPTGDYQLLVTAFDAAENRSSEFLEVFLTEFPSKYYKTLFVTSDTFGNAQLYSYDTLDQILTGPSIGQNITGFEMDNRAQHLLVGQRHGTVTSYSGTGLSVLFQLTEDGGPSSVGCTDLQTYQNDFFWASAYGQYLKRFNKDGIQETAYDQAVYPVYSAMVRDLWVLAGLEAPSGSIRKLDRYDRNQGELRETKLLSWRPSYFAEVVDDKILVGGNSSNFGQLYFTVEDNINQVLDSTDIGKPLLGLTAEGGRTWVWMEDRVSAYDAVYHLGPPTIAGEFTAIGWDSRRQQLWLGKDDLIEVYGANGTLIQSITGSFGTVTAIDFHYNK